MLCCKWLCVSIYRVNEVWVLKDLVVVYESGTSLQSKPNQSDGGCLDSPRKKRMGGMDVYIYLFIYQSTMMSLDFEYLSG